ncbi:hypothetical protein CMI37_17000 [Candidatus Pacearchaeota archaeon]|nr:hypothetical protein [Candidatus Pacearchaeota archaeon]|tara:strand:- start:3119 stop:3466 length:348 start_codon:yes stop_codon:yes gene_type:complete
MSKKIIAPTHSSMDMHNIGMVTVGSRWITQHWDGSEPTQGPYVRQQVRFDSNGVHGDECYHTITTYEADGIVIEDFEQFDVTYACNPDNGKTTMFIKRKSYEETREGIEAAKDQQ